MEDNQINLNNFNHTAEKKEMIGNLELNKIHNGNCIELMKKMPENSVNLILTDPPFAIKFKAKRGNYNRKGSNVMEGYNEITEKDYPTFTKDWVKQAYRVLKDDGAMYVFSGWNNLKDILDALDETGFITLNHLIWKYQFGVYCSKKWVTSHYHILYVVKNPKKWTFNKIDQYPEDVLVINREYWTGKIKTPTKLPTELVKKLILYSSNENDVIMDCFMGSGQTAVVSKMLKRKFIGFDMVKEYVDFANARLKKTPDYEINIKETL